MSQRANSTTGSNDAPEAVEQAAPAQKAGEKAAEPKGQNQAARKAARKKKDSRGALSKLRAYAPVLVLVALAVAFVMRVPAGNLSSLGLEAFSVICPIGALSTLLASKTFIPQAVISLVIVIALIALFGRAFCSWVCSVPVMQRVFGVDPASRDRKAAKKKRASYKKQSAKGAGAGSEGLAADDAVAAAAAGEWTVASEPVASPMVAGQAPAGEGCSSKGGCTAGSCSSCAQNRQKLLDSRHWILGGGLLSAAIFGFPVFCIVCPVGLTFAMVFLIVRLFSGSVSWALLVVPLALVIELVFLRKWCHKFCPIGAFMSLFSKFNKTFVPTIDPSKCIETTTGHTCGRCAKTCPEHIDLRDLAAGERGINECVKCRQCVDACPKGAISMPFMPRRTPQAGQPRPVELKGAVPVVDASEEGRP